MDKTPELVFKEGDLSPDVYSFAQMKGVTSTSLVDFSCRFTWSVTNFHGKNNAENMSVTLNPEVNCISPQLQLPLQSRLQRIQPSFNHVYNQDYPYVPLSSPLSSPISSPQSSQIAIPPPHMQLPRYNYGYHVYPGTHLTPKTFSPVLIYQRPTFTSGNDCTPLGRYGNEYDHMHERRPGFGLSVESHNGFHFNGLRPEGQNDCCKISFVPESNGNCWNQCVTSLKQQSHPLVTHDIAVNQRISSQEGAAISAFQAWKPDDSRRYIPHTDVPPSRDVKPHFQENPYTDSAKLKFFLDTKYGLADNPDYPVAPEAEMGFKSDLSSSLGSEFSLETNFSDPFLDMLHDPLIPVHLDDSEEKGGRRYKCPYCNVSCANNGQLKGHLRVHTGEKPYRCEFGDCERAFARNEELTRHRRIHSGIRPHTCVTCGKKFGRKDHLNKHQKTHLKTAEKKVHVCKIPGCEQRYTRSDALARHQWGAHGIKSKSPKWRTQMRETFEASM